MCVDVTDAPAACGPAESDWVSHGMSDIGHKAVYVMPEPSL
jgi:hypothetical protein